MPAFLGIDTSNYTTSAALYVSDSARMVSKKLLLPVKSGSCGLRQSDAVFLHVQQIEGVVRSALEEAKVCPAAVGVSTSPRDTEGSYMPCFSVGRAIAGVLSAAYGVPLYTFSHQVGHLAAALYSTNRPDLFEHAFLALHLSGGTTDLLHVTPDAERVFRVRQIGGSMDLKAGQAIDRIGVMLGLSFPCGPDLEALAEKADKSFHPRPFIKGTSCAFSGLENQAQKMLSDRESPANIARYTLDFVSASIAGICKAASDAFAGIPFLFAGGVMSNRSLKRMAEEQFGGVVATPEYSSDNAAGIAYLSRFVYEKNNML